VSTAIRDRASISRRRRLAEWLVLLLLLVLYGSASSRLAMMWRSWSAPPVMLALPAALLGLLGVPALRPKRPAVRTAVILCALQLVLLALAGLTAVLLPNGHPPAAIIFLGPLMGLGPPLAIIGLVLVARGWLRGEPPASATFATVLFVGTTLLVPTWPGLFTHNLLRLPGVASLARTLRRLDPRCPDLAAVRSDPVLLQRCPGLTTRRIELLASLARDEAQFGPLVTERLHTEWQTISEPRAVGEAVAALQRAHPNLLPDARHPFDSYALVCTLVGTHDASVEGVVRGALESRLLLAAAEERYASCLPQLLARVSPSESGLGVCQAVLAEASDEESHGVERASIDARLVPLRPFIEKARGDRTGRGCSCEVALVRIEGEGAEALAVELANRVPLGDLMVPRCLQDLGPAAAAAVEPLAGLARAGSVWRRLEAIRALGSIQASAPEVPLVALLADPDWQIRAGARDALGRVRRVATRSALGEHPPR
jgi:hypothetical protein